MYRKKRNRPKKGGFAIAIVMCVLILMLVIGAGLVKIGMHGRAIAVRDSSEISARSAADAGLTQGLFALNQMLDAKTWNDSSLPSVTNAPLLNSDATFSYRVTKTTAADSNDDFYTIESSGKYGLAAKKVCSTLEMKGIFEYAIYVAESLTLKNGTTISAYNQQPGDPPLQIGTNSTASSAVTAKTGVTIDGDIVIGVGGDTDIAIDNKAEAAITGKAYPSLVKNPTPKIKVPNTLLNMASSGALTGSSTISSATVYDSINLKGVVDPNKSDLITVDTKNVEIYVTGDMILGNGDELQILADASLTIYLGGNLFIDNSGGINNLTMDPKKLKTYGLDTCTNIDFKNSGTYYGAIYAPNADIRLHNGVTVYGAMVGKSFLQDVNANFNYDMSLRIVDPLEIGVHLVVKRWSEE